MNTISSLAARFAALPTSADQSFATIALLSGLGLAVSLGLTGLGFDLGAVWL